MELNKECERCRRELNLWALFVSLFLTLVKGVVGILGSSESLVADGLYSFYQSFVALRVIYLGEYKSIWLAGVVVCLMLVLGIGDVLLFSVIRIAKAAKGLLVRPSPYALYAAILSIMANKVLYRYSLCAVKEGQEENGSGAEISQSLRISVIISSVVVIGIAIARTLSIYGDALAALVVTTIVIAKLFRFFRRNLKSGTTWGLSGFKALQGTGGPR